MQTIKRTIKPKLFISFSSYKSFKNCPELYRQYYLVPKDSQEDFIAFDNYEASIGTAVQGIFEHLINKNIDVSNLDSVRRKIDNDITYLADSLVPIEKYEFANSKIYVEDNAIVTKFQQFAVSTDTTSLRQKQRKFISEVATMYRKPLIKLTQLFDIKKMSSEVKMQVEYKDFIIGGRIDFIHYIDKNHIEILDGKRQYNPLWTDPEQVYMYAIMSEKQLGRKAKKVGYWDWSTNKIHPIECTPDKLKETFNNIKKFKQDLDKAIKSNRFRKKKGFYCKWCPIKDSCEKYNDIESPKGGFEAL